MFTSDFLGCHHDKHVDSTTYRRFLLSPAFPGYRRRRAPYVWTNDLIKCSNYCGSICVLPAKVFSLSLPHPLRSHKLFAYPTGYVTCLAVEPATLISSSPLSFLSGKQLKTTFQQIKLTSLHLTINICSRAFLRRGSFCIIFIPASISWDNPSEIVKSYSTMTFEQLANIPGSVVSSSSTTAVLDFKPQPRSFAARWMNCDSGVFGLLFVAYSSLSANQPFDAAKAFLPDQHLCEVLLRAEVCVRSPTGSSGLELSSCPNTMNRPFRLFVSDLGKELSINKIRMSTTYRDLIDISGFGIITSSMTQDSFTYPGMEFVRNLDLASQFSMPIGDDDSDSSDALSSCEPAGHS